MLKSKKKVIFYIRDEKSNEDRPQNIMTIPVWHQKLMRDKNSRKK